MCRFVVVLYLASALAGCFTVTTSSSFTQKDLAKQADAAVQTPTMRADVHKALGEPWLSSDRWRFELYRKRGSYRELLVIFGLLPFPIPAPIPTPKEDLTGYILVTYSAGGIVEGVDTAVSKFPESPAGIQIGDFAFLERRQPPEAHSVEPAQALIASHERFAESDRASCTVLVGCSKLCGMPIEIQLDSDASTKYVPGTFASLVPLTPSGPGAHTLRIWASGHADAGELSTGFTCPAPQRQYFIFSARLRWSRHLEGTVQAANAVPAEFKASGVLIWSNGRWLTEQ